MINESLLDEMLILSKKFKAEVLYNKCLRIGKVETANKIKRKYGIEFKHDDTVSSLWYTLLALKHKGNEYNTKI